MAKKQSSKYVRADKTAVARLIGLQLFSQSVKRKAQFKLLEDLMAHPDFPKPVKKGWLDREQILAFKDTNLAIGKGKRDFKIETRISQINTNQTQIARIGTNSKIGIGEIPASDKPAGDGELFDAEPNFEKSLDLWQDKLVNPERWLMAPIQSWQMTKLQQYRPHLFRRVAGDKELENGATPEGADDFAFPTFVTNLETLAGYYKKKFEPGAGRQFSCNKQTIKHWQAGKGVPYNKPWHPAADSAGRFRLADCFIWFENVLLPKFRRRTVAELPGIAATEIIPLEDLRERDEREQLEFNKWDRARERGEYVHKSVALATGIAAVKRIHLLVKAQDERLLPRARKDKLQALLAHTFPGPEFSERLAGLATEFEMFDIELARSMTDQRETAMAGVTVELPVKKAA